MHADEAMSDKPDVPATTQPPAENEPGDDDVIRIEDLAPPSDVRGGRKILLGEVLTPLGNPRITPDS